MKRFALLLILAPALVAMAGSAADEVAQLVRRIDVDPDPTHVDYTPAVFQLIAQGKDALPAILPLLNDKSLFHRMRAKAVLGGVVAEKFGFVRGRGWPDRTCEERFRALWLSMGNYDCDAPEDARLKAIALWEDWIKKTPNQSSDPTPKSDTPPAGQESRHP